MHELKSTKAQTVGSWPDLVVIDRLRIHALFMTDFGSKRKVAALSIVVQDPDEKFQHPVECESASEREFMRQILELEFADGETVEQKLLERVRTCADPQTGIHLFSPYQVREIPKKKEES